MLHISNEEPELRCAVYVTRHQVSRTTVMQKIVYVRGGQNISICREDEQSRFFSICLNKCFSSNAQLFAKSDTHKATNAHTHKLKMRFNRIISTKSCSLALKETL